MGGSFGLAEFAAVGVDRKDEKTRTVINNFVQSLSGVLHYTSACCALQLTSEEVRQLQTGKQTTLEELHQVVTLMS